MELVEVKRGEVFCDSHVVAKKFGYKTTYITKHIKAVIEDLKELEGVKMFTPKIKEEERIYRGQTYIAYLMNRDFFSILAMKFKGKKAFKWQADFIAAFNAMEQRILLADSNASDPAFLKVRDYGKIARLQETDVIKEFVDYATAQGSTKANFYYLHLTNSCYRALEMIVQRKPKLRDTMNIMELAELQLMEHRAGLLLKKYMELGRNYKDIYNSVKDDLLEFGSGLRIE